MKITKAQIAHHEAGHAVVAWLCDHHLGEVTIRPDRHRGFLGRIQHQEMGMSNLFDDFELHPHADAPGGFVVRTGDGTGRHLTDDELHWFELSEHLSEQDDDEQHVMIAAAGEAAERRHSPATVDGGGSRQDWESVYEHLERLAEKWGVPEEEVRAKLTVEVTSLLDDPLVRRMVEAVAGEVLTKETIPPGEATLTLRHAIRKAVSGGAATP